MNLWWLSSVKTRFVFHIEFDFDFGYAIADLDIWYFTIHEYTACMCGERSQCLVTDWPCAVSDHLCGHWTVLCGGVWSPNSPVQWVIMVCGHQMTLCGEWSPCLVTDQPCELSDHLVWSPYGPVQWCTVTKLSCAVTVHHLPSLNGPVHQWSPRADSLVTAHSDHTPHRTIQWPHGQFGDHTGQFGNHTRWSLTAQGCSVTAHCDHSLHRRVWWLHTVITHHTGLFDDRTRWSLTAQVRLLTAQGDHCTGPFGDRTLWLLTAHACHIFVNSEIPHIEISDCVAKVKVKFNVKCNALFDTTGLPRESDWWNTT